MTSDLMKAAKRAEGILFYYGVDLDNIDPLPVLEKMGNVLLISYDISDGQQSIPRPMFSTDVADAFTLVRRKDGKLQYIIIYNQSLPMDQLRLGLARELGHVAMGHVGSIPESIWNEEASCFAHHFLCPLRLIEHKKVIYNRKLHYRPKLGSTLWEMKSIETFPNIESFKEYIAFYHTRLSRSCGINNYYVPSDVEFVNHQETDCITGWKDRYDVVLNGHVVGYCGE